SSAPFARSGWASGRGEARFLVLRVSGGRSGRAPVTGFSVRPTVISSSVFLRKRDFPAGVATSRPISSRSGLRKSGRSVSVPGPMSSSEGFWKRDFEAASAAVAVDPRVGPEDDGGEVGRDFTKNLPKKAP